MQDKDFDQLFRDRFEDAEIQPSAGLWNNIQKEIAPKRQRKLPIMWLAAASVAITVTAAIVLNKPEKIQLHGQVAVVDAPKKAAEKEASTDLFQQAPSTDAAVEPIRSNASASENPAQEGKILAMQPSAQNSHLTNMEPEIAATEQPEAVTQELPPVETTVAALTKPEANPAVEEVPVAINNEATEVEQSGKTRIRNAGDLLNFVVEKLDKRDQKILEFQTDEDDNSSLVAINIGPFKVNTRKHK